MQITAATYNIQHCNVGGGRIDLPRVAGIINGLNADLVSLQEVHYKTRSTRVDQTKDLAARAGFPYYLFAKSRPEDGGAFGNSVLSKFPIISSTILPILAVPGTPYNEARCLLAVDVQPDGKQLRFCATHFGFNEAQMVGVGAVGKIAQRPGNTVIAGDFNNTLGSIPFQAMGAWYAALGNSPSDNFLYRGAVTMHDYQIVPDGTPDHSPVVAKLEL